MPKTRVLPLLLFFAIFGAACSSESTTDESTRDDVGSIVESGDVGVFVLTVGDCFDKSPAEEISSVVGMPCTEPHDVQVVDRFYLEEGDWPGLEAVQESAALGCLDRFEGVTGEAYETSALDVAPLYPTEDGWGSGDREVLCALVSYNGSKLTVDLLA